jgi:hypothetical protein
VNAILHVCRRAILFLIVEAGVALFVLWETEHVIVSAFLTRRFF